MFLASLHLVSVGKDQTFQKDTPSAALAPLCVIPDLIILPAKFSNLFLFWISFTSNFSHIFLN